MKNSFVILSLLVLYGCGRREQQEPVPGWQPPDIPAPFVFSPNEILLLNQAPCEATIDMDTFQTFEAYKASIQSAGFYINRNRCYSFTHVQPFAKPGEKLKIELAPRKSIPGPGNGRNHLIVDIEDYRANPKGYRLEDYTTHPEIYKEPFFITGFSGGYVSGLKMNLDELDSVVYRFLKKHTSPNWPKQKGDMLPFEQTGVEAWEWEYKKRLAQQPPVIVFRYIMVDLGKKTNLLFSQVAQGYILFQRENCMRRFRKPLDVLSSKELNTLYNEYPLYTQIFRQKVDTLYRPDRGVYYRY